jgi:hypothetical protein
MPKADSASVFGLESGLGGGRFCVGWQSMMMLPATAFGDSTRMADMTTRQTLVTIEIVTVYVQ